MICKITFCLLLVCSWVKQYKSTPGRLHANSSFPVYACLLSVEVAGASTGRAFEHGRRASVIYGSPEASMTNTTLREGNQVMISTREHCMIRAWICRTFKFQLCASAAVWLGTSALAQVWLGLAGDKMPTENLTPLAAHVIWSFTLPVCKTCWDLHLEGAVYGEFQSLIASLKNN